MSLTIKAYLDKGAESPEIRRFAVDQTVSASLEYLNEKIKLVFPSLRNAHYNLFWKDSDNDMVAFSSDEELVDALGYINDGVFRIFIRPEVTNQCSDTIHKGVICDGCEKEIQGPRYKCTTCADYDLCLKCETQGKHNNHEMLRICTPRSTTGFMHFPFMPHPHGPPPPPPPHHPHGPPPHHHHGPPPNAGEDCPPHGGPPPFGPPPYGPPFFGHGKWPWKRYWKHYWRRMMRGETCESNPCSGSWSQANSRDSSRDSSLHDGKEDNKDKEQKENQRKNESNTEQQNNPDEYLRNMGESVAAMLDPLGIDVQVDVETREGMSRCGRGRGRHRGRGGRGRGWFGMWGGPWGFGFPRGYGECPGKDESNKKEDKEGDEESMQTECDSAAMSDVASEAGPKTPTATVSKNQEENRQSPSSNNEGDWTMLNKDIKQDESSPEPINPDARVVYPELPSNQTQNPSIVEALAQMQAMGYSDDGGWLTNLLIQKNGNINAVLDALQPRK